MKTVVVAGGGVVGLSIARRAARSGLQTFLLEKNAHLGMETSARNSEVVHAGIYYARDSWKAKLCVRGKNMLYDFCGEYHVPYNKCGKLIVANAGQVDQLAAIGKQGAENGVNDLRLLSREEAKKVEPEVECAQAILSPSTGIVDTHSLMQTIEGDAARHGADVVRSCAVRRGRYHEDSKGFVLEVAQDGMEYELECDYFVNATGIFAPDLLRSFVKVSNGQEQPLLPQQSLLPSVPSLFAKGTYFKLPASLRPFSGLVYPIPEVGGLGVHATVDLSGCVKFGPDVEWVDSLDYQPDPSRANDFAERIRAYWPSVQTDKLTADYCGIRPKIEVNGEVQHDFFIMGDKELGIPGMVHLCGIESPGLTSCLAIADVVLENLGVE